MASASLEVSHFNYFAFAIFKIPTSLDWRFYFAHEAFPTEPEDSFWKSGVLSNKPKTSAFQSPVLSDGQVFRPLNLKFTPHKREFVSLPTAAGFIGVRGELCSLNLRCCWEVRGIPQTAISNFTHCPTAAAASRANRFAKLVLHVVKMSFVAREH